MAEVPEGSNISAKTSQRVQQKEFAVEIPDNPIIHYLELNGSMPVQVEHANLEHVGEVPLPARGGRPVRQRVPPRWLLDYEREHVEDERRCLV